MKSKNNAKAILLFLLFTLGCSEHPKEQKLKQKNAKGAYITRHSNEKYPLMPSVKKKEKPTYPWEK